MISTFILYPKIHALCTPDLSDGVRNCHRLRCFAISWGFISRLSEKLLRWSKLWVHQQDQLENGDIGIFYLNGNAYIKKYQKNKDNVQLISLNKKYAPIQIKPEMELRTFGKVVK